MELVSFIICPSVIGVLALIIVFAVLTDKEIPFISGDRTAFIALSIINYAMCALGPLPWTKPGEWLSPFNVVLYIIGIIAIFLIVVAITAKTDPIPIVSTYRTAFIILAIIIFSKWILFSLQFTVSSYPY